MSASKESDTVMAQMLKNLQDANREIGRLEQLCRLSEAIIPDMADNIRDDERKRIVQELEKEATVQPHPSGLLYISQKKAIAIAKGLKPNVID
jgi:hypothetical protein